MSSYFIAVNSTRNQFIDPIWFGEAVKFRGVFTGDVSSLVLKWLLRDDVDTRQNLGPASLGGSWACGAISLASDDAGIPDFGGRSTSSTAEPARNMYQLAKEEMRDISIASIAMLCDLGQGSEIVEQARGKSRLLLALGVAIEQYDLATTETALTQALGMPWRKAYAKAQAESVRLMSRLPPILEFPIEDTVYP